MILSMKDLALLNTMPSSSEPDSSNSTGELKIEFDGTTVLCRVCGDKASGFHYGVHSCEGCKGFFRRSIQQKIQYRPCTKNQQCSILRINRNRCQYCRLKKCIAVGMSRDAVRFGRVPKREKAKILAAMQKVNMNSMEKQLNEQLEDEHKLLQLILVAHDETCEFTKDKVTPLIERARTQPVFASPQSMACPLNPMPAQNGDGDRIMEDFSERFSPAIRGVVEYAKRIPGFALLSHDDQVTLLKAGVFEVLLVRLACMFDAQTNAMICLNGLVLRRDSLHSASNARFLMDSMFDFAERMNNLGLSDNEIGLFSAVVVIAPDRPGIRNTDLVQKIHRKLDNILQAQITANHPENPGLFVELKKKIPDLRTLNTLHSEKLLAYKMEPKTGVASSTSVASIEFNGTFLIADRWALAPQSSPSNSDWSDSKDNEYGSPRSVSSSVMSTDESSHPPRSESASSGHRVFSPSDLSLRCPVKRGPSATCKMVTSTQENGHCSSGDESYYSNESPAKPVGTKLHRVDSPTDSGIESGKEQSTSVCSSPRSALDDKVKDVTSDSEGSDKQESIDDMPMLKRALQAPPLINSNMLMDEAYRHHKKFRPTKRESQSPSPSTTTPESLASTHSTLVKSLESGPRLSEQQMKRTDLIHNIIMRNECPTSTSSPAVPHMAPHPQYPLSHQALTQGTRYYIPPSSSSSPSSTGCPYTGSAAPRSVAAPPPSRIMYSSPSASTPLSSPMRVSTPPRPPTPPGGFPMAQHRRSPLTSSSSSSYPIMGHLLHHQLVSPTISSSSHSPVSSQSALVMGTPSSSSPSPSSSSSPPTSSLLHHHLQHHLTRPHVLMSGHPHHSHVSPHHHLHHPHHHLAITKNISSQSGDLMDSQPLNLSMSKRSSPSPAVVKMES